MEISRQTRILIGEPGELSKPVPVKFPVSLLSRLDSVARQTGHNRSDLVRLAVDSWLRELTITNEGESQG